jgi:hypothetical protein
VCVVRVRLSVGRVFFLIEQLFAVKEYSMCQHKQTHTNIFSYNTAAASELHHRHTRHSILLPKSLIEFAGWNGSFTDPRREGIQPNAARVAPRRRTRGLRPTDMVGKSTKVKFDNQGVLDKISEERGNRGRFYRGKVRSYDAREKLHTAYWRRYKMYSYGAIQCRRNPDIVTNNVCSIQYS